jgi:hypothetical protein
MHRIKYSAIFVIGYFVSAKKNGLQSEISEALGYVPK